MLQALALGETTWRDSGRMFLPEGSYANGGAMRIAPVGLAYRYAPKEVLRQAVTDALYCTHVHPQVGVCCMLSVLGVVSLVHCTAPTLHCTARTCTRR